MKKSILTFAFILITYCTLQAQQVLQQEIDIRATIIEKLSVVSTTDVNMGTVISELYSSLPANSIDPNPVSNPGIGAAPGQVVISGAAGRQIIINFGEARLASISGNTAKFTPTVYTSSGVVNRGDKITLKGSQAILDIGGVLDYISSGEEGDYSTSNPGGSPITFTFTYVI